MYPNVHGRAIYKRQGMEATEVSTTDEWTKMMWHKYTMEYYSDIKRKKIRSFVEIWMDP